MATVIHEPTAVSIADAVTFLSVSEQHVRNLISSGTLPASKVGAALRIRIADLDALLERNLIIK